MYYLTSLLHKNHKYECLFPSLAKYTHPQNTKESNYLNDYIMHSFV